MRPPQFQLRSMMIAVAVVAIAMGLLSQLHESFVGVLAGILLAQLLVTVPPALVVLRLKRKPFSLLAAITTATITWLLIDAIVLLALFV